MELTLASRAAPGVGNEDAVVAGVDFAAVLDGATAEPGISNGCRHDVRWFARSVASELGRLLGTDDSGATSLTGVVAAVAAAVRDAHADGCDLSDPRSPAATIALLRVRGGLVEYLVLGDAVLLLRDRHGAVGVVTDDRILRFDELPWSQLHRMRNVPGGFWVVSSDPRAADEAISGATPVAELDCAAVLTDGAARLVERYGWTWAELLIALERDGPAGVISATREAEQATPPGVFEGKRHDDATAVFCRFHAEKQT